MKVKINEDVLFHNLEGGAVLLNTKTEEYFGFDEVGTSMWNSLLENQSVEEAYQKLVQEYDIEPAQLYQDLQNWIKELAENQLLSVEK
jgi:hypothetical protein